ncbi:Aquaglycerol porin AQY3 [Paramyrothecium foliicola]|nr:Aquaglycerol porin AQY3 [Paramyrothecium foliicola]
MSTKQDDANSSSPNSGSSGEDTLADLTGHGDCHPITTRNSYGFGNGFTTPAATPYSHRAEGSVANSRSATRRPGLVSNAVSNATSRIARSSRSANPSQRNRSYTARRPALAPYGREDTRQPGFVWTDEDYHQENPWYSQKSQKPIFSLGGPLPHVVRRRRKIRRPVKVTAKKDEETGDIEEIVEDEILGEEDSEDDTRTNRTISNHPDRVRTHGSTATHETTRDVQQQQYRATAAGVAHNDKRNDAGQPVFDYIPGPAEHTDPKQDDATIDGHNVDRSRTTATHQTRNQPEVKIDDEPLGHQECPDVEDGEANPDEFRNWWARLRAKYPEPLAELLATCVAVFLGLAATLSVNLSSNQPTKYGDYETSCWAWGFAWMFGIYLGGGVSGAHMNPAISISLSVFRGFPWRQCAIYVFVQFIASIAAGGLAYGLFADSIHYVDPELSTMSQTFFSTPQEWVSFRSAFANQVAGSAVQMMAVLALGDDQNNPPGAGMHALIIGLLVTTTKWTLGYNIGSALNPASDFGPRVVAYAAGCRGPAVFQSMWWLYGPWLATVLGSIVGGVFYDGFVFVGTESPVNYKWSDVIRSHSRSVSEAFSKWRKG